MQLMNWVNLQRAVKLFSKNGQMTQEILHLLFFLWNYIMKKNIFLAKEILHLLFPESGREGFFQKKALPLKTVIKDCQQRLPKVLLKWWLSLKIVIKDRPKFYWSDVCL